MNKRLLKKAEEASLQEMVRHNEQGGEYEPIKAVVRVTLEECLRFCEESKAHALKTYGVAESVGAEMVQRKIEGLLAEN